MEIDPEIAAAMGFGSFGNTSKKRRIEEAFTEYNYADFNPSASGTNATPLGPRRKSSDSGTPNTGVASPAAADATSTSLDSNSADQNGASEPDPTEGMTASDARKFKKSKKKQETPSGLAGFLNRGHQLPDRPTTEPSSTQVDSTQTAAASAAPPPESALAMAAPADSALTTASLASPVDSVPTAASLAPPTDSNPVPAALTPEPGEIFEPGIAYFRPSFIEDPWSKLPASSA